METYLAIPAVESAAFFVPVRWPPVLRYVYRYLRVAPTRLHWLRSRLLVEAFGRGIPAPSGRLVTVASKGSTDPAALDAVVDLVGPPHDGFALSLGPLRDEGRVVFHVFDGVRPRAVVKCDRRPVDVHEAEDRKARAVRLREAIGASPWVAAYAPHPIGSLHYEGGWLDAETASVGSMLIDVLRGPFSRQRKLRAIEAVAAWSLALAEATRHPLHPQSSGATADAATWQDDVPRVVSHGDLWSGNIVVNETGSISVIDWADIDRDGLPFGDLFVFLTESLAELDGAHTPDGRASHFVELVSGWHRSSPLLFEWIAAMVDALAVVPDAVGEVIEAALAEMAERRLLLEGFAPGDPARELPQARADPVVRTARLWADTPGLGSSWRAWRQPRSPADVSSGADADLRADAHLGADAHHREPDHEPPRRDGIATARGVARRIERRLGHGAGRLSGVVGRERGTEFGSVRVLVLAPHPDDETLATGGVLARHAGRETAHVVVASDGSRGAWGANPVELAARRRHELANATAALGLPISAVEWWGLPDGSLSSHLDELTARIATVLTEFSPDVVFAPWAFDLHPDHAALGLAARRACAHGPELLEFVTWAWDRPSGLVHRLSRTSPGTAVARRSWRPTGRPVTADATPWLPVKRRALACYGSQLGSARDGGDGEASLDDALLRLFLSPDEVFWPAPRPGPRAR